MDDLKKIENELNLLAAKAKHQKDRMVEANSQGADEKLKTLEDLSKTSFELVVHFDKSLLSLDKIMPADDASEEVKAELRAARKELVQKASANAAEMESLRETVRLQLEKLKPKEEEKPAEVAPEPPLIHEYPEEAFSKRKMRREAQRSFHKAAEPATAEQEATEAERKEAFLRQQKSLQDFLRHVFQGQTERPVQEAEDPKEREQLMQILREKLKRDNAALQQKPLPEKQPEDKRQRSFHDLHFPFQLYEVLNNEQRRGGDGAVQWLREVPKPHEEEGEGGAPMSTDRPEVHVPDEDDEELFAVDPVRASKIFQLDESSLLDRLNQSGFRPVGARSSPHRPRQYIYRFPQGGRNCAPEVLSRLVSLQKTPWTPPSFIQEMDDFQPIKRSRSSDSDVVPTKRRAVEVEVEVGMPGRRPRVQSLSAHNGEEDITIPTVTEAPEETDVEDAEEDYVYNVQPPVREDAGLRDEQAVLSALANLPDDSSSTLTNILKSVLNVSAVKRCARCGMDFDVLRNSPTSCRTHPGRYVPVYNRVGGPGGFSSVAYTGDLAWSCCHQLSRNVVGCVKCDHSLVVVHPEIYDEAGVGRPSILL